MCLLYHGSHCCVSFLKGIVVKILVGVNIQICKSQSLCLYDNFYSVTGFGYALYIYVALLSSFLILPTSVI